jgi:hypothetical protein
MFGTGFKVQSSKVVVQRKKIEGANARGQRSEAGNQRE